MIWRTTITANNFFQLYNNNLGFFFKLQLSLRIFFNTLKEKNIFGNWQIKEGESETISERFTLD